MELTAVNAFVCDLSGRFDERNYWNTVAGDEAADLFLSADGINGQILNAGAVRAISVSLDQADHLFTLFCDAGAEAAAYGVNLYFDGSSRPQISVFAEPRSSAGAPIPDFSADGAVVYGGQNFGQAQFTASGADTLTVEISGMMIELTEFWWARKTVFSVDRVGKYGAGADGSIEHIGQFQLRVSPIQPPIRFRRGDTDANGRTDIVDAIRILFHLYSTLPIECLEAADVDDRGSIEITDAIGLLGYLFLGTIAPAPPFSGCGEDQDGDAIDCRQFDACP